MILSSWWWITRCVKNDNLYVDFSKKYLLYVKINTLWCFQIPLTPSMFPVWDFVVKIFVRKVLLNMGRVLLTLSCKYLYKWLNNSTSARTRFLFAFPRIDPRAQVLILIWVYSTSRGQWIWLRFHLKNPKV